MPFPTTSFDADTVRRAVREEMSRYHSPRPAPVSVDMDTQTENYPPGSFADPYAEPPVYYRVPQVDMDTQTENFADPYAEPPVYYRVPQVDMDTQTETPAGMEMETQTETPAVMEMETQTEMAFGIPQSTFPPLGPDPSQLPRDPLSRFTDFERMRVPELKRLLIARGLSIRGLKSELVQRLRESIR